MTDRAAVPKPVRYTLGPVRCPHVHLTEPVEYTYGPCDPVAKTKIVSARNEPVDRPYACHYKIVTQRFRTDFLRVTCPYGYPIYTGLGPRVGHSLDETYVWSRDRV